MGIGGLELREMSLRHWSLALEGDHGNITVL